RLPSRWSSAIHRLPVDRSDPDPGTTDRGGERFARCPKPALLREGYAGDVEAEEERIALFLDYENLAIGARESLHGMQFDLRPVLDALGERGRVIARKDYADGSCFDEDRRMLTRSHVELIEIPQRMGAVR